VYDDDAMMRSDPAVAYQPADVSMPESYGIAKSGYSGRASEPPPRRSPAEGAKDGFYRGRPNDSARRPRSPSPTSHPYGAQEGLGRPAVSATQPRPPQPYGNPYGGQEGFGRPAPSATQPQWSDEFNNNLSSPQY